MITKSLKPVLLKDVLVRAIEGIAAKQESPLCKEDIEKIWETAVGKEASRHSRPVRFKGNLLMINVDSSTWIYQLNIKKKTIEQRMGKLLKHKGPLKISLRVGED